jgi:hypothetical protein
MTSSVFAFLGKKIEHFLSFLRRETHPIGLEYVPDEFHLFEAKVTLLWVQSNVVLTESVESTA